MLLFLHPKLLYLLFVALKCLKIFLVFNASIHLSFVELIILNKTPAFKLDILFVTKTSCLYLLKRPNDNKVSNIVKIKCLLNVARSFLKSFISFLKYPK